LWDFSTTQSSSILSSTVLNTHTIDLLSKYINYFNTHISTLGLLEHVTIKFPTQIDLSISPQASFGDPTNFLKAIEESSHVLKVSDRSIILTSRELECLHMLSEGQTIKETARILKLSPRTVEKYLNNIKHKSRYNLRSELTKMYRANT